MITGKQRAYLRGLAQNIDPIFQVGKKGIEDAFIKQVDEALEKRELIKIKVLENSGMETREASDIIKPVKGISWSIVAAVLITSSTPSLVAADILNTLS